MTKNATGSHRKSTKRSTGRLYLPELKRKLARIDREIAKLKPELDSLPRMVKLTEEASALIGRFFRRKPAGDPAGEDEE